MPSSSSKIKSYKGPRTHRSILAKIREEAYANKHPMSTYHIERVVVLFFSSTGLGYHFRRGVNFFVKGLGFFIINRKDKGRIHAAKIRSIRMRKRYLKAYWRARFSTNTSFSKK